MVITDFADLMPDTVTHAEHAGNDRWGSPSYGSPVSFSARVVYRPESVRAADGAEVVARGHVWLLGSPAVDPKDEITLPDATTPPILAVERFPDENGAHHTKIFFG